MVGSHLVSEDLSDKELLNGFRNPDTRNYFFNLLIRKYEKKIYYHIRRLVISHDDANDVTQETFIKIWKNLDRFKEESQLFTWIYRIATNEAITFLRKKRTRFMIPLINIENRLAKTLIDDNFLTGLSMFIKREVENKRKSKNQFLFLKFEMENLILFKTLSLKNH